MKYSILAAVVVIAATLSSCSDSTTPTPTPTPAKNFLPLKVGNYWLYSRQEVDTLTNDVSGPIVQDSAYVSDSLWYNNRAAFRILYARPDAMVDTTFFSKDSATGTIYTFVNTKVSLLDTLAPALVAPALWVKVKPSDDAASWKSLDTTFTGVMLNLSKFGLGTISATIRFEVTGATGASKSATIAGTNYDAREYIQYFKVIVNGGTISYTLTQHFYFVENVGLWLSKTEQSNVMTALSPSPVMRIAGSQRTMTKFSLK